MTNFHFCRTLTQMGRKPRLKHQKRYYCSSRVSKSLVLETRNMQPLVTTTTLKTRRGVHAQAHRTRANCRQPYCIYSSAKATSSGIARPQNLGARAMQSACFHPFGPVQRRTSGLPSISYEESSFKGASELVICKMEMKGKESIAVSHFELSKISVGPLLHWVERWS